MDSSPAEEWLTPRELATQLKIHPRTVLRLIHGRVLPALKVRGQWRIKKTDADAWKATRHFPPRSPGAPDASDE